MDDILRQPAEVVAKRLLGSILERTIEGAILRVQIVETEAYDQTDPASHSHKGPRPRSQAMFGEPGHLYVYFTYGMHYCCNIVTGESGFGSGVLIRAVEPILGEDEIRRRRGDMHVRKNLTNGPGKLCVALGIDKELYGHDLRNEPLQLIIQPSLSDSEIMQTTRVGISKGIETPWRFYVRDNLFVSKK